MAKRTKTAKTNNREISIELAERVEAAFAGRLGMVEIHECYDADDNRVARIDVIPGSDLGSINDALWSFGLKLGSAIDGDEFNRIRVIKL